MFQKALLKQRDSSLLVFEEKKKIQNIEQRKEKGSNNLLLQIYCDESIFLNFSAKTFFNLILLMEKI